MAGLARLFGKRPAGQAEPADALYRRIVEQARTPVFYRDQGVPDNLDGRFELIALHTFLVLHRLKQDHPAGARLGQSLYDLFFADMDQSLREMGAGDLGVGKRVKRMAQGFHGRVAAYDAGLSGPAGELEEAIRRNLYGTLDPDPAWVGHMAAYTRAQSAALREQGIDALLAGRIVFSGEAAATGVAGPS